TFSTNKQEAFTKFQTERQAPIMNKENITNVNTSEPKNRHTKKHLGSTLQVLKSSQKIISNEMNEEYFKKVMSNNRQGKKMEALKNK
ncbi:20065_t:CDS:1, partial [Cetraspora pellucida]